jgi:hypothetical protein
MKKINQPASMITLLPQGAFIIMAPTKDGKAPEQVKGKFDMMAIENFANNQNIPGIYFLSEKFQTGMQPTQYADFILCAIHRIIKPEHCEYKHEDVLEWIAAMGGFTSNEFGKLILQGIRLFINITSSANTVELTEDEKKILGIKTVGKISGSKRSKAD